MVVFFSGGTIAFDGFSMVLAHLDHYHCMFFHKLTIVFDGFSKFLNLLVDKVTQRWNSGPINKAHYVFQ